MSVHAKVPGLADVIQKLRELVAGEASRQEVSEWASPWIVKFEDVQFDKTRELDRKIKEALDCLASADIVSTDRPYLYGQSDFERWLGKLTG